MGADAPAAEGPAPPAPWARVAGAVPDPTSPSVSLRVVTVGSVVLTGSGLVVCDPMSLHDAPHALRRPIGPGAFPVEVSTLGADGAVACAALRVSPGTATRWEMGLRGDQDPGDLAAGEVATFGVDSGTACFADAGAIEAVFAAVGVTDLDEARHPGRIGDLDRRRRVVEAIHERLEEVHDQMLDAMEGTTDATGAWLLSLPEGVPATGRAAPLVAFPSGYGDGGYPVWLGYGGSGDLVEVLADFGLLPTAPVR